jgi:hypothetical protein
MRSATRPTIPKPQLSSSTMKHIEALSMAAVLWLAATSSPLGILHAAESNSARPAANNPTNIKDDARDPDKVVRMYRWDIPFPMLAARFTQADIPAFVAILKDDNRPANEQSGDYTVALGLIWRLSSRNDDRVAAELLEAFKKPINFAQLTNNLRNLRDVLMCRRNILEAIGRVGGTNGESILKQALSNQGAKELSKAWFTEVPREVFPPDNLLAVIRGGAAMGLVFVNTPEALELVRAEYNRERQACVTADKLSRYYNYLASAMACMDALKAMGYDKNNPTPTDGTDTKRTIEFAGHYSLVLGSYESDPVVR